MKCYIFFEPCKVPTVFPLINSSCVASFFFGQSSKLLSANRLRCDHRCLQLHGYFHRTCFVHTHRPRTAWRTSRKANKFSCTMQGLRESRYETLQAYFRLPQSRLQAFLKCMYAHDTRPFSNGTPPSQLRTN